MGKVKHGDHIMIQISVRISGAFRNSEYLYEEPAQIRTIPENRRRSSAEFVLIIDE